MTFFWIGVFGTVFLGVSSVFDGDADMDADADVDIADADVDHGSITGDTWLSLRVLSCVAMGFGYTAAYLNVALGVSLLATIVAGSGAGLSFGWVGKRVIRWMYGQQANSLVEAEEMLGLPASVTTPIPDGGLGEITFSYDGQSRVFMARSLVGAVPRGSSVFIHEVGEGRMSVSTDPHPTFSSSTQRRSLNEGSE